MKDLTCFFYWQHLPASLSLENYLPPTPPESDGVLKHSIPSPNRWHCGPARVLPDILYSDVEWEVLWSLFFPRWQPEVVWGQATFTTLVEEGNKHKRQKQQEWEKSTDITQGYWQKLSFKFPSHTNQKPLPFCLKWTCWFSVTCK